MHLSHFNTIIKMVYLLYCRTGDLLIYSINIIFVRVIYRKDFFFIFCNCKFFAERFISIGCLVFIHLVCQHSNCKQYSSIFLITSIFSVAFNSEFVPIMKL
ncbi:hypothetical protein PUN28_007147 [Cardiocondyla obscurior]|uniref:Uncharacterized protein n=1 Tax=Cardiocondyla obscurior TaxID=286306 RepID=A0AAW2G6X6_9HYME